MLCKTNINYFNLYEQGKGQGQANRAAAAARFHLGLGDVVAFLIRIVTFGLLKMCSECESRKQRLNRRFPLWPIHWPWGKR
jgi:hypothetical protein